MAGLDAAVNDGAATDTLNGLVSNFLNGQLLDRLRNTVFVVVPVVVFCSALAYQVHE